MRGPSWQLKPVSFEKSGLIDNQDGTLTYKVEKDNTLGNLAEEIAKKTGRAKAEVMAELVELNDITDPNRIEVNQPIKFSKHESLSKFALSAGPSSEAKAKETDRQTSAGIQAGAKKFAPSAGAAMRTPSSGILDLGEIPATKMTFDEFTDPNFGGSEMIAVLKSHPELAEVLLNQKDSYPPDAVAYAAQIVVNGGKPPADSAAPVVTDPTTAESLPSVWDLIAQKDNERAAKGVATDPVPEHSAPALKGPTPRALPDDVAIPMTDLAAGVPGAQTSKVTLNLDAEDPQSIAEAYDIAIHKDAHSADEVKTAQDFLVSTGKSEEELRQIAQDWTTAQIAEKYPDAVDAELPSRPEAIVDKNATAVASPAVTKADPVHVPEATVAAPAVEPMAVNAPVAESVMEEDVSEAAALAAQGEKPVSEEDIEMAAELLGVDPSVLTETGFAESPTFKAIFVNVHSEENHPIYHMPLSEIKKISEENYDEAVRNFPSLKDWAECDFKDYPGKFEFTKKVFDLYNPDHVELVEKSVEQLAADRAKLDEAVALLGVNGEIKEIDANAILALQSDRTPEGKRKSGKELKSDAAKFARLSELTGYSTHPKAIVVGLLELASNVEVKKTPKSEEQLQQDARIRSEIELLDQLFDQENQGKPMLAYVDLMPVVDGSMSVAELVRKFFPHGAEETLRQLHQPYTDLDVSKINSYEKDPRGYVATRVKNAQDNLQAFQFSLGRMSVADKAAFDAAVRRADVDSVAALLERYATPKHQGEQFDPVDGRPITYVDLSLSKDAKTLLSYKIIQAKGHADHLEGVKDPAMAATEPSTDLPEALLADAITKELAGLRKTYYDYNPDLAQYQVSTSRNILKSTGLTDQDINSAIVDGMPWQPNEAQTAAVMAARTSNSEPVLAKTPGKPASTPDESEESVTKEWTGLNLDSEDEFETELFAARQQVAAERAEQRQKLDEMEWKEAMYSMSKADREIYDAAMRSGDVKTAKALILRYADEDRAATYDKIRSDLRQGIEEEAQQRAVAKIADKALNRP